jgi:MFS family permease
VADIACFRTALFEKFPYDSPMDNHLHPASLDRLYSKVTRRIVPLMVLGYIAAYLDRVNVGFAKLQMLGDLKFSETVYGFGAGVFFVGYFLLEVPSNLMLHRIGARRWLARIMISWGIISAAMIFVTTPASFYALRFLLGAAEAGFFPGVIYYLTQWYPAERRGRIVALFMTAVAICSVAGSLISGVIMQAFDGVRGLAGWQWLFLIEALPALAIGVYYLLRLTDSIQAATWLQPEEKAVLAAQLSAQESDVPAGTFKTAFQDWRVWVACLIYFACASGIYGLGFWLPTIVADLGVKSVLEIGMLTAIPYAVAAVGMVLVGRSSDKHRERRWHFAVSAACGGLGLVLSVLFSNTPVAALAALTLATFGVMSASPLFWNFPTAFLRGAAAAAGIAIINSNANIGGFVIPFAVGALKDATGSTANGRYFLAALLFGGAGLALVVRFADRRSAAPARADTPHFPIR